MSPDRLPGLGREIRSSPSARVAFECSVTYESDEARVLVRGELGLRTVSQVRRAVLAAAVLPIGRVTIDLEGVDAIDRYAVNFLITLREQVREQSTRFVLASPSPPVRRALVARGEWDHFEHETVWTEYPSPELSS